MQRLLQSHPKICGGEESHFFTLFAAPMVSADKMAEPENGVGPLHYITRIEFDDILRDVWDRIFRVIYNQKPRSKVHLEKTPFHALYLDQIQRLFPSAKVIFLTRDSRAVTSSLVHAGRTWGDHWAPKTYRKAAIEWHRHVCSILDWRSCNPDHPVLQVRYEDALTDTEGELARILRFLLPDAEDLQIETTLQAFEGSDRMKHDPEGFSRRRGTQGWKTDMPLHAKLTTWRYTRKLMRELGYDISILD